MRSRELVLIAKAFAEFGGARGSARLLAVRVAAGCGGFGGHAVGVRSRLRGHLRIPRKMPITNKGSVAGGFGMCRSVFHEGNYKGRVALGDG